MFRILAEGDIDAPPAKVWELLSSPERYPELVPATDELLGVSDGPFGKGTFYREYGGLPPFKGKSEWEVTEFEPITHQRHIGDDGSMKFDLRVDIQPRGSASHLSLDLNLTPRWYLVVPSAILWFVMLKRRGQAMQDETVVNTKRAAEAESRGATSTGP